ncbi:MAG: prephenate dehydrogenase [Anaerolineales bacterium]|nr:prephenate dehydrogenase [Anaerolineales bacterium]
MSINITIVGLGQIGGSIGLALANQKQLLTRLGHDLEIEVSKAAQKAGAIDNFHINLPASVENADLVILALPFDQMYKTLEVIAPSLKEGAVVMDTSLAKQPIIAWVKDLFPEERYYVGLTPVLNPDYLYEWETGFSSAKADLFHNSVIGIVSLSNTPSDAIKLGFDLVNLLGAKPFFTDPMEIDGLMATTHVLPEIMAISLMDATYGKPGWKDARKIAGRPYAHATVAGQMDKPQALASFIKSNQPNIMRLIDVLIEELVLLKQHISDEDQSTLATRFEKIWQGQTHWLQERRSFHWEDEDMTSGAKAPTTGEIFGRFIGLGQKHPKKNSKDK